MNKDDFEESKGRIFIEEKEFPDNLEGRLSSVLNAVNIELKTVTLLHLDDRPADRIEIRDRIRDTRGKGYLPFPNVFGSYGNTLHNIALVAKQTIVRDDGETQVLGYSLTEAGKMYGVPIAEHVLKWVVDNNLSMYSILGVTQSSGKKRSSENRIGILEALSTGKANEAELTDFLGLERNLNSIVQQHLISLSKIGFIYWDSIGAKSKGFSKYILVEGKNPKDVETVGERIILTKKIAQEMSKGQEFDCNSLSEIIGHKSVNNVSVILAGLERQGFLRRATPFHAGYNLSNARILEPGERFLEEVLYPVKEHLSDSSVLETDFGERDSKYVARGIDIYKKVSPRINQRSFSERIQQVKSYLLKNPGSTVKEITNFIGLGGQSVKNYLKKLGVRIEKEEHEVRYFLDNKVGK